MAIKFEGMEFIEFDMLLSDDERLVRDNASHFSALTNSASQRWTRHDNVPAFAVEE